MLLELAEHIAPVLTIADAVTGMEGNGPGGGDPVFIGALLASRSPLALDTVATALVGMGESDVWTQRLAVATRRPGSRLEEIDLQGDALEDLICRNFRPAKSTEVNFNLPPFLQKPLRRSMSALPVVKYKRCRLCGLCIGHCPPEVMRIEKGRLRIDYNRCIGCFCCQELCPEGALLTRQGLLLRLSRFLRASKPEKQ
jgi:ferredoxin